MNRDEAPSTRPVVRSPRRPLLHDHDDDNHDDGDHDDDSLSYNDDDDDAGCLFSPSGPLYNSISPHRRQPLSWKQHNMK